MECSPPLAQRPAHADIEQASALMLRGLSGAEEQQVVKSIRHPAQSGNVFAMRQDPPDTRLCLDLGAFELAQTLRDAAQRLLACALEQ